MEFREYLENEQRLEFDLFERIHQEDPEWIGESVMDIVRGGGRFLKGVAQSGAGIMDMGDEALARLMGDGTRGRFKGGWERLGRGVGNMGSGLGRALVGSGSAPEKTAERIPSPAIPSPAGSKTTSVPAKNEPLRITVGKDEKVALGLQSLIDQYGAARSAGERRRILAVISMKYPHWYQPKLAQAKNRERRGRAAG